MKIVCMSLILIVTYILLIILDHITDSHKIMNMLIKIGRVFIPIGSLKIFIWIGCNASMYGWQWGIMLVLMMINVGWLYIEGCRTFALLIANK